MYLHEFNMDTIQFCLPKILIQKMSALLHGRKIQLVFSALFFLFFSPAQVMQLAVECSKSAGAVLSTCFISAQFRIVFCCT